VPAAYVETERPETIVLKIGDGDWITVHDPTIEGDSIDGMGIDRTAISGVNEIKVQRFSPLGTAVGLAISVGLVTVARWFVGELSTG